MLSSSTWRGIFAAGLILTLVAGAATVVAPMLLKARTPSAKEVQSAISKANLYIEVAKGTERAADSWDRYASWVNLKTGPTGNERYITYGMYELYDIAALLKEARAAMARPPKAAKIDAAMQRYIVSYEALEPVMSRAAEYHERKVYLTDGMAEGKLLHVRMLPLALAFMAEREAMLKELRPFVREVEGQEVAATEAREGRSRTWQGAHVMHAAARVIDVFPRPRPVPVSGEAFEEQLRSIGPNTPGARIDEIIAGVQRPAGIMIDMKQFDAALKAYAEAVETFDRFSAEKPEGLKNFKELPRQLLDALRALQEPLSRSKGHDFEGSNPLVGRVVQTWFNMISASSDVSRTQLRFLQ